MKIGPLFIASAVSMASLAVSAQELPAPRLLGENESPSSVESTGTWPKPDGSDVGLRHSACPTTSPPAYSGSTSIKADGTTIFNRKISSMVVVDADNVTLECVEIQAPNSGRGILVRSGSNLRVSKAKIHNVATNIGRQGKCIYFTGGARDLTVEHSEFTDCEDGIHSEGTGAVYRHNWFHDMKFGSPLHSDPVAVAAGSDVTIVNNRFGPFEVVSAAVFVQPAGSCPRMDNIDVIENFIDGDGTGNTFLNDRSVGCTCPTGMDILNNTFGPKGNSAVGYGSGEKQCPPVAQRGGSCVGNKKFDGSAVGC